jgi:hypothetical protein
VPETWLFAGYVTVGLLYLALFLFPARLLRRRRTTPASGAGTPGPAS